MRESSGVLSHFPMGNQMVNYVEFSSGQNLDEDEIYEMAPSIPFLDEMLGTVGQLNCQPAGKGGCKF